MYSDSLMSVYKPSAFLSMLLILVQSSCYIYLNNTLWKCFAFLDKTRWKQNNLKAKKKKERSELCEIEKDFPHI